MPELLPLRHGRMSEGPLAFYRATAAVMARDLASTPTTGLAVQLCGDAHLDNFGLFASPERTPVFDLSDFDETAVGPWEWDLKRLATSFVLAARQNKLSKADGRSAAKTVADSYHEWIQEFSERRTLKVWNARVEAEEAIRTFEPSDRDAAQDALRKADRQNHLRALEEYTTGAKKGRRFIADPPGLVPLTAESFAEERELVRALFRGYRDSLADDLRRLLDRFEFVDVARKVVGVGSVGLRCWIVFLKGGAEVDPLFLQVKEARASVLPPFLRNPAPPNQGERVIAGQRLVQAASDIFLGWTRDEAAQTDYYVRQFWDDKGEFETDEMNERQLEGYARLCGRVLAGAHARTGDAAKIAGYLGEKDGFDEAIRDFAVAYADQAKRDYERFADGIKAGLIAVETDA